MSRHRLYQYFLLICGSLLFPIGVTFFITPWQLNTGGLVGISQILSYLVTGGSMKLSGVFNGLLNVPLFLLAWKSLSRRFLTKTVLSITIQSILLSVLPVPKTPILADVLSNVLFGGIVCGAGVGLCLQSAGSAGGLDILGVWMAARKPGFSVGKLSYIVNAFVLGISAFLFGLSTAMYSIVFIVIMYFVSDQVHLQNISMYGLIITANPAVKEALLHNCRRGVTKWDAVGAYTGNEKEVLLCTMDRYEVRHIRKLIKEIDPQAFFLLTKSKVVLGNFERRLTD